jgi:signal transduction histidine kinase
MVREAITTVFQNREVPPSKRYVLKTGFLIIIALLVISTGMAYKVQDALSKQSESIHRNALQQQNAIDHLRNILWQSSTEVRDYLLEPEPDPSQLAASLGRGKQRASIWLAQLREHAEDTAMLEALAFQFDEYWDTLGKLTTEERGELPLAEFVKFQLTPRKVETTRLLESVKKANNLSVSAAERQFRRSRQTAANNLLLLLGTCLLSGIGVAVVSLRYADALEQQSSQRLLQVTDAHAQLERLSARLIEVQEEERTRLSRELHDEIVQNLAVMKMEIRNAEGATWSEARAPLARARELAERTVRTVRDISLLLRPSLLDDLGLGSALQWLTEEFMQRTGVPCTFTEENLSAELPDGVKTCAFRVTQEALRNCEKHSHATAVSVRVCQFGNQLELAVEDNGIGISNATPRSPARLGLLGMRERAAMLRGTLKAETRAKGGTVVTLTIPLEATAPRPGATQHLEVHA